MTMPVPRTTAPILRLPPGRALTAPRSHRNRNAHVMPVPTKAHRTWMSCGVTLIAAFLACLAVGTVVDRANLWVVVVFSQT